MAGEGIAGGLIGLAGAVLTVIGIYRFVTSDFVAVNIPTIGSMET